MLLDNVVNERYCSRVCVCVRSCVHTRPWSLGRWIRRAGASGGPPGRRVCPRERAVGVERAGLLTRAPPPSPDDRICSPPFMELTSLCGDDTMRLLEKNGLAFPFSAYRAPGTHGPTPRPAPPPGRGRPEGGCRPSLPGSRPPHAGRGSSGGVDPKRSSAWPGGVSPDRPARRRTPPSRRRVPPAPRASYPEGLQELGGFSWVCQAWLCG